MARRKFNELMHMWLKSYAKKYTCKELISMVKEKFGEDFTLKQMQQYMFHHGIEYKKEMPKKSHSNNPLPLGSERIKSDGMTQIKIGFPNKWEYKQRLIYEEYYGVKLPSNVYVIFLDGNKQNFEISNLKAVPRKYCSSLANYRFKRSKEDTELLLLISKMNHKIRRISEN